MSDTTQDALHGKAEIVSKFNFTQEVWFLNGFNICKGKVVGIKGEHRFRWAGVSISLEIETSSGNLSSTFWLSEEDLFESRDALVNRIITA